VMLVWVVVVVEHEGGIGRVCGLMSGMSTSSWERRGFDMINI